jgi:hypothetical protein
MNKTLCELAIFYATKQPDILKLILENIALDNKHPLGLFWDTETKTITTILMDECYKEEPVIATGQVRVCWRDYRWYPAAGRHATVIRESTNLVPLVAWNQFGYAEIKDVTPDRSQDRRQMIAEDILCALGATLEEMAG